MYGPIPGIFQEAGAVSAIIRWYAFMSLFMVYLRTLSSSSGYIAWNSRMISEYRRMWKETTVARLKYHTRTCLQGLVRVAISRPTEYRRMFTRSAATIDLYWWPALSHGLFYSTMFVFLGIYRLNTTFSWKLLKRVHLDDKLLTILSLIYQILF
jgi:hypothetical protein